METTDAFRARFEENYYQLLIKKGVDPSTARTRAREKAAALPARIETPAAAAPAAVPAPAPAAPPAPVAAPPKPTIKRETPSSEDESEDDDDRSRFFLCIVCVVLDVASPRGTKATRAKSGCELHCTTNFSLSSFIKCIVSVCGSNCMQLVTFSGNLERMDAMDATSAVKSKFGGRCFSGFPVV